MLGKLVSSFYSMVVFGCSKYIHVLYCMLPEMFHAGKKFEVNITLFFWTCVMYVCGMCAGAHVCVEATCWREGFFQHSYFVYWGTVSFLALFASWALGLQAGSETRLGFPCVLGIWTWFSCFHCKCLHPLSHFPVPKQHELLNVGTLVLDGPSVWCL